MNRRPRFPTLAAASFAERGPPPVVRTDPPRNPLSHRLTRFAGLLGQKPVSELGVVSMPVEQRIRPIHCGKSASGHGFGQPPVVRLASELQHPGTSPPREPVRRQDLSRAGRALSRKLRSRQRRRGAAQHFVLLLQQPDTTPRITQLGRLGPSRARSIPVVDLGLAHPFRQRHRMHTETSGNLLQRHPVLTVTSHPEHVLAELLRTRLGHGTTLPGPPSGRPDRCHLSVQQPLQYAEF